MEILAELAAVTLLQSAIEISLNVLRKLDNNTQ